MHLNHVLLLTLGLLAAPLALPAQDEAKQAIENTLKTLDLKANPPSSTQTQTIIKSVFPTLEAHPAHNRTRDIIRRLHDYAGEMDKKSTDIQADWFGQTRLTLINELYRTDLDPKQIAALHAADAALATSEAKINRSKDNLTTAREKIDALAQKPGNERFLPDREFAFYETLKIYNAATAVKFITTLAEHPIKDLATRAQKEVFIIEIKSTPFDLTLTDHKGKPFDTAKLRGKQNLYLHFWSIEKEDSMKQFEKLADIGAEFSNLVIIGINLDKESDRPAVLEAIKKRKAKWPHFIEGLGADNSVAKRLNIRQAPAGALFDTKGYFAKYIDQPDGIRNTINASKN